MKPLPLAISLSLSLFAINLVQAQDDEVPSPKPPYIAPVPDYGHWTVSFKYSSASTNSAPNPAAPPPSALSTQAQVPAASSVPDGSPTAIDTIKTGDLRGVVLTFGNGTTKQFTCQGNWVLTSTPKGPQLVIANSTYAPYIYYTPGFVLLDGVKIDPTTFKETAKHGGVMAFHYQSGDTQVWIAPKSMLPIAVKQPGLELTYQFLNPPPRPFPIPQDQESLLQQERAASNAVKALR